MIFDDFSECHCQFSTGEEHANKTEKQTKYH
jgi:hypothetical protein